MSVWLFARQELLALRRDHRAWAAAGALLVLLAAAFVSGDQTRRAYERARTQAQDASHRQWLAQGTKNAHSAAHFSVYAFRPLPELAPFEPGLHAVLGTTVYLEAHKANDLRDAPDEDGSRLIYLDGSAAFLARTVLPLLLFLLVASSIAGERERGTLKMLLAQGGTLAHIAFGKSLALIGLLVALIVAAGSIAIPLSGAPLPRIVGLAGGYALFALTAVFVAMAVSTGASDSRRAVVVLFFVWAASAIVAPRLAASLASVAAPMPMRSEAAGALERELDPSGYERRTDELRARLLEQHGVKTVDALPFDFRGRALDYDEERGSVIFDRHRASLRAREAQQDKLLFGASVLLPWVALERWSSALAGTDLRHADHFADFAERYRRELVGRMNQHLMDTGEANSNAALWSTIQPFAYEPPGWRSAAADAWLSFAVLALWAALRPRILDHRGAAAGRALALVRHRGSRPRERCRALAAQLGLDGQLRAQATQRPRSCTSATSFRAASPSKLTLFAGRHATFPQILQTKCGCKPCCGDVVSSSSKRHTLSPSCVRKSTPASVSASRLRQIVTRSRDAPSRRSESSA